MCATRKNKATPMQSETTPLFLVLGVIASIQVLFDESTANHLVIVDRFQLTANVFMPASVIISQNLQKFYSEN